MNTVDEIPTLFVFNKTAVKVRPLFWLMVVILWALLSWLGRWRWPGQSLGAYLLVGGAGTFLALLADVGHACAHTVSARLAKAPMDTILLGADMPRTLYANNNVSPRTHIIRSLGGPVYSGIGLLVGIGWLVVARFGTAVGYLGEIWTATNGFIFLALFTPLPLVDGGVILKWTLVWGGMTQGRADELVERLGLGLGVGLLAMAVLLLAASVWFLGGLLCILSFIVLGAALNIIR